MDYKSEIVESYKGFDIVYYLNGGRMGCGRTAYYCIVKEGELLSILALNSPKACRNVINAHLRVMEETPKPIYK